MSRYLPGLPLVEAAMAGRPRHQTDGCPYCERGNGKGKVGSCVSDRDLGRLLDVDPNMIGRWRTGVRVESSRAEALAKRLGLLDYEVWPELLERAIEANQRVCGGCGGVFIPLRKDHKFCKPNCRQRTDEWNAERREKYATEPEFREAVLASNRKYKRSAARALNAYQRRYNAENAERVNARRRARYAERKREAA